MNIRRSLQLLGSILLLSTSVVAQEAKTDSTQRVQSSPNDQIIVIIDQIKALNDSLRQIMTGIDHAMAVPGPMTQKGKIQPLPCDSLDIYDQQKHDLEIEGLRLRQEVSAQHTKDSLYIQTLTAQLATLDRYENDKIKALTDSVESLSRRNYEDMDSIQIETAQKFFKLLYANLLDMDSIQIETAQKNCNLFTMDKITKVSDRLTHIKKGYDAYSNGVKALEHPYSYRTVNHAREQIHKLNDVDRTARQVNELSRIDSLLTLYPEAVLLFKDLIKKIDTVPEDSSAPQTDCEIIIDKHLDSINKINKIPWLKDRYNKYIEDLMKSPFAENQVRNEIMEIKILKVIRCHIPIVGQVIFDLPLILEQKNR